MHAEADLDRGLFVVSCDLYPTIPNSTQEDQRGIRKYGLKNFGGNNFRNGTSVRSVKNTIITSHSPNRMIPYAGAYDYRKCPKSCSEPVELGPQYLVQRLACCAISASAELPVCFGICYFAELFKDIATPNAGIIYGQW